MINPIKKWLRGNRDYQEGLNLLSQIKPGHRQLSELRKGPSEITQGLLVIAMRKLSREGFDFTGLDRPQTTPKPEPKQIEPKAATTVNKKPEPKVAQKDGAYPPEIEKAKQRRAFYVNQRNVLANSLVDQNSDEERKNIREEMDRLQKLIKELWIYIDYYFEHGHLRQIFEPRPKVQLDETQKRKKTSLWKQRKSAMAQRSKRKKQLLELDMTDMGEVDKVSKRKQLEAQFKKADALVHKLTDQINEINKS